MLRGPTVNDRRTMLGRLSMLCAAVGLLGTAEVAHGQVTFDSPAAKRPPPNVMLLLAADRTNQIAANCSDGCHGAGGTWGFGYANDLWHRGETRIQLVRRAMTGGYGVDTMVVGPDGDADAIRRSDGVMDAYKVRWGVAWYDGLGTRLAIDPTTDAEASQRAMIDFGQTANDHYPYSPPIAPFGTSLPGLNSYNQFPFTVWSGCYEANPYEPWVMPNGIPWERRRVERAPSRTARALRWAKDYFDTTVDAHPYQPSSLEAPYPMWFSPGATPDDENVIDSDVANVLNSSGAAGCRRNFVILMSDGGGLSPDGLFCASCDTDGDGDCEQNSSECAPAGPRNCGYCDSNGTNSCTVASGECEDPATFVSHTPGAVARDIYNLGTTPDPTEKTQVFSIHFGDWAMANDVADFGWDGVAGGALGTTTAFNAAPGGVMNLPPMLAAFGAIFSMVLAGDYTGTAPTLTRAGTSICSGGVPCDHMVVTDFKIHNCAGVSPVLCNIGRPSGLKWVRLDPTTGAYVGGYPSTCNYPDCYDMGSYLRSRNFNDRNTFTGRWAGHGNEPQENNCGPDASCGSRTARMTYMASGLGFPAALNADIDFVRGRPTERFVASLPMATQRGDTNMDGFNDTFDPYKLANISNSRPVIVGAPPGVGELVDRWAKFRDRTISRSPMGGADPSPLLTVKARDQVVYVGANDGFLHAFLVGKAAATAAPGSSATYEMIGSACPDDPPPVTTQFAYGSALCDGQEIWAYSPRMLHDSWNALRGGHYYMVDATPVVEDVLFTKNTSTPGPICGTSPSCGTNDWEYRTVLVQCLGAGGTGCFAMDVTNPWNPSLLWERRFSAVAGKGTSTSQPVIARAKKTIGGRVVPYYVALLGGGHNESGPTGNKGTFIAVGLEDGVVYQSPSCNPSTDPGCADFAGPPTCTDTDNDSFVDTCYIPTTKASVYKVRINGGDPSTGITMREFFRGRHSTAGNNPDLRAFTKIIASADIDNRLNLVFGTGNIDDPSASSETNYLFKFRDLDPKQAPVAWTPTLNTDRQADACSAVPSSLTLANPANEGSFRLAPGEKILFNPTLVGGSVMFTSYEPEPNPCLIGSGALYGIRHDTCANGIDSDGDGTTDTDKVDLGTEIPGEVAVSYGKGNIYVTNTTQKDAIDVNPARPPPPARFRVHKLNWRKL